MVPATLIGNYKIITGKYDSNCGLQLYLRSELCMLLLLQGIIINWYLSIVDMIYENMEQSS